jgi:Brp/Blh family beta-carotene 15,15'-monooxygenase
MKIHLCSVLLFSALYFSGVLKDLNLQVLVSSIFIAFLALPHGALDVHFLVRKDLSFKKKAKNFFIYISLVLGYLFAWLKFPDLSFSFFIVISVFHFAEGDSGYFKDSSLSLFEKIFYGLAVISLPMIFYAPMIKDFFAILSSETTAVTFVQSLSFVKNLVLISAFLMIIKSAHKKEHQLKIMNIVLIVFAGVFLPPMISFLTYFCFYHSLNHWHKMKDSFNALKLLDLKFFVILLCSFLLAFAIFMNFQEHALFKTLFIFLAIVTLPHLVFVSMCLIEDK